MQDTFRDYYLNNFWQDKESVSGRGSNLKQTRQIRKVLPSLLKGLEVQDILDIPCGDFYWMSRIKEIAKLKYIGADIVPELIYQNRERSQHPNLEFQVLDATKDRLPRVDLILCRDMLGHLSNANVKRALQNFKDSGSTYLLATTFPGRENSGDIEDGQWRPINLGSMWGLPTVSVVINEGCTSGGGSFADKSLGLWRIN